MKEIKLMSKHKIIDLDIFTENDKCLYLNKKFRHKEKLSLSSYDLVVIYFYVSSFFSNLSLLWQNQDNIIQNSKNNKK